VFPIVGERAGSVNERGVHVTRVTVVGNGDAALRAAVEALGRGLVVAYPTDTLYGLAVDPTNAAAVTRLFALKGRALDKAIPLIAGDVDQARAWAVLTPLAERLAGAFWPGPLTFVLASAAALDARILGDGGTVAIRVPAHGLAAALALAAGRPITSTSANPSGQPPTADPDVVGRALPAVDVLLDAGVTEGGAPSTIVDVRGREPVLIRAGAIAWERVLESLGPASTSSVS
jgi:L-threonylcarbamoyladenylate synthase